MKKWIFGLCSAACLLLTAGCTPTIPQDYDTSEDHGITLEIEDATRTLTTTADATTTETTFTETTEFIETEDTTFLETTFAEITTTEETTVSLETTTVAEAVIDKDGTYTSKEDVALYIYTYGELPQNFISKKEAQALGWSGGSLEPYAPGKCIGGSYFGNYEGVLPKAKGRQYTECDIDTLGKSSRGAKRIVFSNDGLIYYTDDHYETFTLLYGEE